MRKSSSRACPAPFAPPRVPRSVLGGGLAVVLALCAAAPARGDVVHRSGGGKVIGRVISEDEEKVVVETRTGRVTVFWEEIDRIERGPVEDLPAPAAPRAPKADAQPKAEPAAPRAPAPRPAAPAPKPRAEPPAQPPAGGTSTGTSTAADVGLEAHLAALRSRDQNRRAEGMAALAATAPGREALRAELARDLDKRDKALVSWFKQRKDKLRRVLAERARVFRAEAYAFIMDPAKYPEENHGAVAQPEVDRLVARLERAYRRGYEAVREESAEVRDLEAEVKAVDADARRHLGDEAADALGVDARLETRAKEISDMLSLVGVPLDAAEQRTLDDSRAALEWNRTCATSVDAEERACIDETNRYRMLFGLVALRIDERLVKAARGHSKDMVDHRFFDHMSPVAGKRTPEERCRAEGANYSGENIAMGSSSGLATFRQWYTSSGHHRNILTKGHLTIGIGRDRNHWTQNFGMDRVP